MSLMGNLIWLIFGGFLAGVGYIIGGLLICLTIVGIPFGMKSVQLGMATMTPFGKEVVQTGSDGGCFQFIFSAIWLVLFGWEIALAHLLGGVLLTITIIGIPFAKQHFKLIPVALLPFVYDFD